ncbi:nucleolar MIF4G domain-containing protein 1 [Ambystoma mexicanum]|uniref:nucleolar MIF4G domain-containing protein 1 n=1 Tax=Ambystoma mexicanum TaxID=8296 RepID=UPI0037E702A9
MQTWRRPAQAWDVYTFPCNKYPLCAQPHNMKRKQQQGRGRGSEQFKKLKLSVEEFVQSTTQKEPCSNSVPGGNGILIPGSRRKSRKELRKENRKLKKYKRKEHYEGKQMHPYGTTGGQATPPGHTASKDSHQLKDAGKSTHTGKQVGKGLAEKVSTDRTASRPRSADQKKQNTQALPAKPNSKGKSRKEESRKMALIEANEQEEIEIRRLEKILRLNKRKNKNTLPQSFAQDGLDYILSALEPGATVSGLYESDDDANTAEKLQELSEKAVSESGGDSSEDEDGGDIDESAEEDLEEESAKEVQEDEESTKEELGKDLDEESEESQAQSESDGDAAESVEKADLTQIEGEKGGTKYVPPHMRQSLTTMDAKRREDLERLKKSVKGLINRLSEPNMAYVSGQLEELYMTHSRNDMNETLTNILMDACVTPATMPDRLMMEHVLLVSILHHTVGIEVGAHVLESFVKKFDELYKVGSIGKECDNLLILVAHLYNFHVVESLLIFDILKKLVGTFSERDIELVLLLLKNVGFLLRKDDALALKELIGEAQNKANNAGKMFLDQSRVRFMLETMLALKNNDMRKIPGYDPEPVEKLRKLQRSRVSNVTSGSATQLRVSLENLLDAEQVGRWWIVGSSWSGVPMIGQSNSSGQPKLPEGKASSKMMALARKQRMNTDIRRNIFCVLMSSEDFLDAFENLLKLGLKDQQEREIVHILIDCCLQEKTYNPFYSFLSAKFCEYDRRFQMTFQFSVWDKFRDLENLTATAFSSLVQLLVQLLKSKSLQLSVFKVIEFSELNKTKVSFLRQVLYKLLMETEAEDLSLIFGRVSDKPKLAMMREGLKLFITHFLLKNARAQKSAEEASLLQERAALASSALQAKDSRLKL